MKALALIATLALGCGSAQFGDGAPFSGAKAKGGIPLCRVLNTRPGETCTCGLEDETRGTAFYVLVKRTERGLEACMNAPRWTRIACRCGRMGTEETFWHDEDRALMPDGGLATP